MPGKHTLSSARRLVCGNAVCVGGERRAAWRSAARSPRSPGRLRVCSTTSARVLWVHVCRRCATRMVHHRSCRECVATCTSHVESASATGLTFNSPPTPTTQTPSTLLPHSAAGHRAVARFTHLRLLTAQPPRWPAQPAPPPPRPPARCAQLVTEGERWTAPPQIKLLTGVDIFVDWSAGKPDELAAKLNQAAARTGLKLKLVTNRGVKVWPGGFPETFCTDHWCV
jgi:hypothetical protein